MKSTRWVVALVFLLASIPAVDAQTSSVAFASSRDGNPEIYTMPDDGSVEERHTTDSANDTHPSICKRGTAIAYQSNRDAVLYPPVPNSAYYGDIFIIDADATTSDIPKNLTLSPDQSEVEPDCSVNTIVFQRSEYLSVGDYPQELWTISVNGTNLTQLTDTTNNEQDTEPSWCGDVVFLASNRPGYGGDFDIWRIDADGGDLGRCTGHGGRHENHPDCSPDRTFIVFDQTQESSTKRDIIREDLHVVQPHDILTCADDGQVNLTDEPDANDYAPSFSPGGTFIAFVSDRTGSDEIYKTEADPELPPAMAFALTDSAGTDTLPDWSELKP